MKSTEIPQVDKHEATENEWQYDTNCKLMCFPAPGLASFQHLIFVAHGEQYCMWLINIIYTLNKQLWNLHIQTIKPKFVCKCIIHISQPAGHTVTVVHVHAMNVQVRVTVQNSLLTSALDEVNGHLHALANLPPTKEPPLSTEEVDGWPPQPAWMLWTRETYSPARTETTISQLPKPQLCHHTECAIPANTMQTLIINSYYTKYQQQTKLRLIKSQSKIC